MNLIDALDTGLRAIKDAANLLEVRGENNARLVVVIVRACDSLHELIQQVTAKEDASGDGKCD